MKLRNCTKMGFMEANVGDGVSLDNRKIRGRVQHGTAPTLMTNRDCVGVVVCQREREREQLIQVGELEDENREHWGCVYSADGSCPAVTTKYKATKIEVKATKIRSDNSRGYMEADVGDGLSLDNRAVHCCVQHGTSSTLMTLGKSVGVIVPDRDTKEGEPKETIRILTPREFWRVQDFYDENGNEYYDMIPDDISEPQRYKQAGNSIAVGVLEAILVELYKKKHPKQPQITSF